jgi:predicted AAA+ superfamily ATPase
MRAVRRDIEPVIRAAMKAFPAVVLTGPRRAGKTWLLRHLVPDAAYALLEDPDVVARVRADPRGFLDALEEGGRRRRPIILDEVQHLPEIFSYVRSRIDARPRETGRWLLTGSQESPLLGSVTESMAGRAAVLQLLPLSSHESPRVEPAAGGFPEPLARPRAARLWFSSYVQTYLERDVRAVTAVRDLATFRRFLGLLASRHGQLLNKTDLAAPLGVSVPTISQWLGVLEVTGQVLVVPPYFDNLGKRLVKSPKIYFADSGLACHLLGIEGRRQLERSPFRGAIFEGFIAAEIVKAQQNAGRRREIYHFRDQQGLEVDFLVPLPRGPLLVECKASATVTPSAAGSLLKIATAFGRMPRRSIATPADGDITVSARGQPPQCVVVHQGRTEDAAHGVIAVGVQAERWQDFVDGLIAPLRRGGTASEVR